MDLLFREPSIQVVAESYNIGFKTGCKLTVDSILKTIAKKYNSLHSWQDADIVEIINIIKQHDV